MELKDMILSTLAELDGKEDEVVQSSLAQAKNSENNPSAKISSANMSDEESFLQGLRERVLVLFEGLQSPQNKDLDAKLDITLNFLEFLLALTEERLKNIHNTKNEKF